MRKSRTGLLVEIRAQPVIGGFHYFEAIGIEFHQRLGGGVPDRGVAYRAGAI